MKMWKNAIAPIWFAVAVIGLVCSVRAETPVAAVPVAKTPELMLYCGAGIRPAAEALIQAFESNRNVKVVAAYGGSGQVLGQLTASKQGDLFMPGEAFYVEKAVSAGLADPASRRDFAWFIPTIIVQKGNPLGVTGLRDLAEKNLRVGLGDERAVAVGRKSVELFQTNGIPMEAVLKHVMLKSGTVNELGVAIETKNIDAAIVWDATARQFAKSADEVVIPLAQNIVTPIPVVRLKFSQHPDLAAAFIQFVASEEGRRILTSQHYTVSRPQSR
jgi:molybdate transport system substrate-binding protein